MKELPLRPPLRNLLKERCFIPRALSIQLSKSPGDEHFFRFPKRGPYGKRCPSVEGFLHILQGPQQGSPPSRFPSQRSHRERHSTSRAPFNHTSKSPVDEPTPDCPAETPWREMPIHITFRAPSKRDTHPCSLNRAPIERDVPFPEPPFNYPSEFQIDEPPTKFPSGAPMQNDIHPLSPLSTVLPVSQEGAPLNRSPAKRDTPFPEPSNYLLKFPVNGLPRFPNGP
jgi:hypothetical protein